MPVGFFKTPTPSRKILFATPQCGSCGLWKHCKSPKMKVAGEGRKGILICGEAPGSTEDSQGKPFIGKTGQHLQGVLSEVGIDLYRDCWIVNAARCKPIDNKLPEKAVDYCRPYLVEDIKRLNPHVIIPLGAPAVKSLLGWIWRDDPGGIGRWVGWKIPCQKPNAWICPAWHPSHVVREANPVVDLWWKRHLEAVTSYTNRPWKTVPDFPSKVEAYLVPDDNVLEWVRQVGYEDRPVAFDYETNMLKPDGDKAEIVCVSLSDGLRTVAFPWEGERVVKAFKVFLLSPCPKIASNLKFEERWTLAVLGIGVKNWFFDTMLAAHVDDNRSGVCSVKFQAFRHLGQLSWDESVKLYLKADGANTPNRIRECDVKTLLKYCGMDSLMEWKTTFRQRKVMKFDKDDS